MDDIAAHDTPLATGQRGPVEHERREQIIAAADEHFRHYGYQKTTVADLARAIGVSSAYVYRFFESKQAIGEAVCRMTLQPLDERLMAIASEDAPAADRLRRFYRALFEEGFELFFNERRLHDIVVAAVEEGWGSVAQHKDAILQALCRIVADGRERGEFERKTPLDEVCRAIFVTTSPFCHPVMLEQTPREEIATNAAAVSSLVLRSLSP
ncbi:TetR family transcriptional regulator [Methyloversatilis sp. XJ19-13]|uniref:TetR/AcrR family transcriptional regulator n=1 Tax=unclassified Methyloversatilis TaxID=2639971 RepID=UPI00083D2616|nr:MULTISPECIES: TetR/AcrR family transcriptional regulator [unclassified Methyloversatilis]AOF80497.1 bacterial regulatory s, tetR family protein [Methyloversatilis sp. RAC08]MCQ9372789.1 TetR family transcriptional regulator [Methyloversatilis sp. XJ19-13]